MSDQTSLIEQFEEDLHNPRKKGLVDKYLAKFVSSRLMVWALCYVALLYGKVDGKSFMFISVVYLFVRSATDLQPFFQAYMSSGSTLKPATKKAIASIASKPTAADKNDAVVETDKK